MIPRFKPYVGREELGLTFHTHPNTVEKFERVFAEKFGANAAVAFPYGRSAIWAFLKAVGIQDAEIILPAYTCSVVAHAIALSGNLPRPIDIELTHYNMDLDLLADAINDRTRAIIATHLFGYPLDIDRLEQIVQDAEARFGQRIWVIQDCAHSFGATWNGRRVGSSGDAALYAFNVSKMMTAVFGGLLTFSSRDLAERVRTFRDLQFRSTGITKPFSRRLYLIGAFLAFSRPVYGVTWWLQEATPFLKRLTDSYHLDAQIRFPPDYLDRMLDFEAAVGLKQIEKYDTIVARRIENAQWLDENLERKDGWTFPPIVPGATYSHYVVRVPNRDEIVRALAKRGVELGRLIQYSIPHLPGYESSAAFDNSLLCSRSCINVPVGPRLTAVDRNRIASTIRDLSTGTTCSG